VGSNPTLSATSVILLYLYELDCGPHTAYSRAVSVPQLLRANGINKLLSNRD
jgi:hypothetical protein